MDRHKIKVGVYALLVYDNKILLGRRMNTGWQDGNYGLPSGHLENDESLIEALVRETKEETGLEVKPEDVALKHVMHVRPTYVYIFFLVTRWSGIPQIMEQDKCDDLQWFPLDALPENIVPTVKLAIENYQHNVAYSETEDEA